MRRWLNHETPWGVEYADFFVTICCRPKGLNQLCWPEKAQEIIRTLELYHQKHRWFCSIALWMPDHVHLVVRPGQRERFSKLVGDFKRCLTKKNRCPVAQGFLRSPDPPSRTLGTDMEIYRPKSLTGWFGSVPERLGLPVGTSEFRSSVDGTFEEESWGLRYGRLIGPLRPAPAHSGFCRRQVLFCASRGNYRRPRTARGVVRTEARVAE